MVTTIGLPRPPFVIRAARVADAMAQAALAAAAAAFSWPLIVAVPLLAGPSIALGAGVMAYTFASALARPRLAAANDNAPWPSYRVRAVGHRPALLRRAAG